MTVRNVDRLLSVVEQIYRAPAALDDWQELSQNFLHLFSAESCLFVLRQNKFPQSVRLLFATENLIPIMPAYTEHYHKVDQWAYGAIVNNNRAVLGTDLIQENDLVRSEWYNDLALPANCHHVVGSSFDIDPKYSGLIGIHRGNRAEEFDCEDRRLMGALMPHLSGALRMTGHLERHDRERRLGFEALSRMSVGLVVVDASGRVLHLNAAAERIVQAGVLRVAHGRLSLADPKQEGQLLAAIRAAALASVGRSLSAGTTMVISLNHTARLPLVVRPMPSTLLDKRSAEPLASIFIGELEGLREPTPALLKSLYGLTSAESKLALALCHGQRLSEYADDNGLSINTVRSHLKSTFARVGCNRQSDLIRTLLANPILQLTADHSDTAAD